MGGTNFFLDLSLNEVTSFGGREKTHLIKEVFEIKRET